MSATEREHLLRSASRTAGVVTLGILAFCAAGGPGKKRGPGPPAGIGGGLGDPELPPPAARRGQRRATHRKRARLARRPRLPHDHRPALPRRARPPRRRRSRQRGSATFPCPSPRRPSAASRSRRWPRFSTKPGEAPSYCIAPQEIARLACGPPCRCVNMRLGRSLECRPPNQGSDRVPPGIEALSLMRVPPARNLKTSPYVCTSIIKDSYARYFWNRLLKQLQPLSA